MPDQARLAHALRAARAAARLLHAAPSRRRSSVTSRRSRIGCQRCHPGHPLARAAPAARRARGAVAPRGRAAASRSASSSRQARHGRRAREPAHRQLAQVRERSALGGGEAAARRVAQRRSHEAARGARGALAALAEPARDATARLRDRRAPRRRRIDYRCGDGCGGHAARRSASRAASSRRPSTLQRRKRPEPARVAPRARAPVSSCLR